MAEPLRILQVVTKMDRGGLETFIMNMYRNINRSQVQFDFLCHREGHYAYDDEIESLGGKIYHVPRCNPFDFRYLRMIDSFFAGHPYRIVHSHINCMSALPLAASKRNGVAVRIAHSHSSSQSRDIKYPIKLLCKRFIRREATDLFACGVEAGRWMFGTDNFKVVRNAINVEEYAFDEVRRERMRERLGIEPSTLVVGHVGRFVPVKNHEFVVEVFSELLKIHPCAVLLLIGDGELRSKMESRVRDFGISGSVRFLGLRSDIPDLMRAMDIFLMPSLYEGLPLVLVEAQATGLPCVISDSIPGDCDFTGSQIRRISLTEKRRRWAEIIVSAFGAINRSCGLQIVRDAGFDAKTEASKLEDFYLHRAWGK